MLKMICGILSLINSANKSKFSSGLQVGATCCARSQLNRLFQWPSLKGPGMMMEGTAECSFMIWGYGLLVKPVYLGAAHCESTQLRSCPYPANDDNL